MFLRPSGNTDRLAGLVYDLVNDRPVAERIVDELFLSLGALELHKRKDFTRWNNVVAKLRPLGLQEIAFAHRFTTPTFQDAQSTGGAGHPDSPRQFHPHITNLTLVHSVNRFPKPDDGPVRIAPVFYAKCQKMMEDTYTTFTSLQVITHQFAFPDQDLKQYWKQSRNFGLGDQNIQEMQVHLEGFVSAVRKGHAAAGRAGLKSMVSLTDGKKVRGDSDVREVMRKSTN